MKQYGKNQDNNIIITGRNAVLELIHSGKSINKILINKNAKNLDCVIDEAKKRNIVYKITIKKYLDSIIPNNQGVIAYAASKQYISVQDLVSNLELKSNPRLCLLDEIKDPHNLGAIARSAHAFNINGLIISTHNSCAVNNTVYRSSAGYIEHLPIARVKNLVNTIKFLKKKGYWIIGTDQAAQDTSKTFDFKRPLVLVLGNEYKGLKRLVKENCDALLSIPINSKTDSLNVSCAAAIFFYESIG